LSILNLCYSVFLVLFVLSTELDNTVLFAQYREGFLSSEILQQNHKIGYPILWGLSSFALMILGLKRNRLDLRIIAIVLFLLVILKLVIFDVWEMQEAGRIATFAILGLILVIVSFMYQKLKKMLFEKDENLK